MFTSVVFHRNNTHAWTMCIYIPRGQGWTEWACPWQRPPCLHGYCTGPGTAAGTLTPLQIQDKKGIKTHRIPCINGEGSCHYKMNNNLLGAYTKRQLTATHIARLQVHMYHNVNWRWKELHSLSTKLRHWSVWVNSCSWGWEVRALHFLTQEDCGCNGTTTVSSLWATGNRVYTTSWHHHIPP